MTERSVLSIPSPPLPTSLNPEKRIICRASRIPTGETLASTISSWFNAVACSGRGGYAVGAWRRDCVVLLPDAYHYAVQECQEETSFYWLHFQTAPSSATGDDSISHNIKAPKHGPIPYPEQAYQLFDSLHLLATEPRSTAFWREQTLFIELERWTHRDRTRNNRGYAKSRSRWSPISKCIIVSPSATHVYRPTCISTTTT